MRLDINILGVDSNMLGVDPTFLEVGGDCVGGAAVLSKLLGE